MIINNKRWIVAINLIYSWCIILELFKSFPAAALLTFSYYNLPKVWDRYCWNTIDSIITTIIIIIIIMKAFMYVYTVSHYYPANIDTVG